MLFKTVLCVLRPDDDIVLDLLETLFSVGTKIVMDIKHGGVTRIC